MLPDSRVAAIRRDEILPTKLTLAAGLEVLDDECDAILVLVHALDLGALEDPGSPLAGTLPQNGLQVGLIQIQPAARAQSLHTLIQSRHYVGELASRH